MGRVITADEVRSRRTVALAKWLLGKVLVRSRGGRVERSLITEVEAYDGERDLACHASRGRTPRTQVMYAAGGVWYVYLVYGLHHLVNLVTGPEGYPAAVLLRGVDVVNGPGRLTQMLRIDRRLNGMPAAPASGLHLEDVGFVPPRGSVRSSPRIGVDYAGPIWAAKPWRFQIKP